MSLPCSSCAGEMSIVAVTYEAMRYTLASASCCPGHFLQIVCNMNQNRQDWHDVKVCLPAPEAKHKIPRVDGIEVGFIHAFKSLRPKLVRVWIRLRIAKHCPAIAMNRSAVKTLILDIPDVGYNHRSCRNLISTIDVTLERAMRQTYKILLASPNPVKEYRNIPKGTGAVQLLTYY